MFWGLLVRYNGFHTVLFRRTGTYVMCLIYWVYNATLYCVLVNVQIIQHLKISINGFIFLSRVKFQVATLVEIDVYWQFSIPVRRHADNSSEISDKTQDNGGKSAYAILRSRIRKQ